MVRHADLIEMWDADSDIDHNNLVLENARTGKLHSKYVAILLAENAKYEEMLVRYEALEEEKRQFYLNGTDEVWRAKGWKEWPGGKVLKTDIGMVLPQDEHIIEAKIRIGQQKAKVKFLESIVNHIKERSWLLKNITAEKKFLSGE